MLQETCAAQIEAILARYDHPRSAVLPLLYLAQDTYGYLTNEAILEVANLLNLPQTDVFEVVSFYTLFYDYPVGKWVLQVCDDVPCCYLGAEEVLAALAQKLGVREDQLTPDGHFLVQRVKCLAACHRAPVVQANLDYIYDVTPERVDELLRSLRERIGSGEVLSVSGATAEDYEYAPAGHVRMIERRLGDIPAPPAHAANAAPVADEPASQVETDVETDRTNGVDHAAGTSG
ncbi:MAG: NAD(P)H-dependent oxidoreductase subunit E [Chloroflexaceae bacterium]|nr:NAD(P)H-dependent oxidoreductase subunit E [Chloroflexaceae bacterium]